jgi:Protein of unknown function (DUF1554)
MAVSNSCESRPKSSGISKSTLILLRSAKPSRYIRRADESPTSSSLPGTYKAWLSSNTTPYDNPAVLFTRSNNPYVLRDATTTVANNWAGFVSSTHSAAIYEQPTGVGSSTALTLFWSGTNTDGTPASSFPAQCNEWTDATSANFGSAGANNGGSGSTLVNWEGGLMENTSPGAFQSCSNAFALVCVEQ